MPARFDLDEVFGPLEGFDDGRRWNGFPAPWLTEESLGQIAARTREVAAADPDVERLERGGDGWVLRGPDGEEPLERLVGSGPDGQVLFRLEGWSWDRVADDA